MSNISPKYVAAGWLKFAEKDNWETGCYGPSNNFGGNDRFEADTPEKLIEKLNSFMGNDDPENLMLDACEEPGRVDIQRMENDDGNEPSAAQYAAFKAGKLDLWAATYSFRVYKVYEELFSFAAEKVDSGAVMV